MDNLIWARMHGGTTHFPIALMITSLLFDASAVVVRRERYTRDLHTAGFYTLVLGALACFPAVFSGLMLSHWDPLGSGMLLNHHACLWPGFGLMVGLAVWRLFMGNRATERAFRTYLATCIVAAGLLAAAGYWGGEMLINATGQGG